MMESVDHARNWLEYTAAVEKAAEKRDLAQLHLDNCVRTLNATADELKKLVGRNNTMVMIAAKGGTPCFVLVDWNGGYETVRAIQPVNP